MEIKYGWNQFRFELSNVKFNTWVELEEKGEDGEWATREIPMLLFLSEKEEKGKREVEAWEKNPNIRYSGLKRSLSATARFPEDSFDQMYLGVPEDKNDVAGTTGRIKEIDFFVRDIDAKTTQEAVESSCMIYTEADDDPAMRQHEEAGIYSYVTPDFMDSLERSITSSDIKFEAAVHLKCWYFRGPIGDDHLYINKERWERAELVRLTTTKTFTDQGEEYIYDDPNYDGEAVGSTDVNVNIYKKLSSIEGYLKDARKAVILVAVVAMVVVVAGKLFN